MSLGYIKNEIGKSLHIIHEYNVKGNIHSLNYKQLVLIQSHLNKVIDICNSGGLNNECRKM